MRIIVNADTARSSWKSIDRKSCFIRLPRMPFDELHLKKLPKVKDLNAEYAEILAEKKKLYGEYRQVKKDMQENQRAKYDID